MIFTRLSAGVIALSGVGQGQKSPQFLESGGDDPKRGLCSCLSFPLCTSRTPVPCPCQYLSLQEQISSYLVVSEPWSHKQPFTLLYHKHVVVSFVSAPNRPGEEPCKLTSKLAMNQCLSYVFSFIAQDKKIDWGLKKMSLSWRALASLAKYLGSVPSTHMSTRNHCNSSS